jgi:hypothetical protein
MLMLRFILLFNANDNRKILGNFISNFKANIHGHNSMYWFKFNLT